jgi:flavin reductase (DIM6/NTAB) family NADH-FMN oxidoreductase RutF
MKEVKFNEYSKELMEQIPKGAFLTVKDGNKVNTMTIGWGSLGVMWMKPVFTVMVRFSRYTYEMLQDVGEFTVSVPLNNDSAKALAFCGTKSGRDCDKVKECGLTLRKGEKVDTPVIAECELHYECKVIYKQVMEPATLDKDIRKSKYSNNDYHVMFYGEIVSSYIL